MNTRHIAKRLERYLRNEFGWETHDNKRVCKCGRTDYGREHKFCASCGAKLPKAQPTKGAIDDIEEALRYALNTGGKQE